MSVEDALEGGLGPVFHHLREGGRERGREGGREKANNKKKGGGKWRQ